MSEGSESLAEIYEREFEHVWRSLRRFGVKARHLEDVAQEVFIVVHRRLKDYDRSRPLRPWLTGIAFKVAADHRGRASVRRESLVDPPDDIADDAPRPDEIVERWQKRRLVERALQRLDDNKRFAFVMHDLDGCPVPQIAELAEVPVATMYSRLRLARAEFMKAIAELKKEGGT